MFLYSVSVEARSSRARWLNPTTDFSFQQKPLIWRVDHVIVNEPRRCTSRDRDHVTTAKGRQDTCERRSAQPHEVDNVALATRRDAARRSADAAGRRGISPRGGPREDRRDPSALAAKRTSTRPASELTVRDEASRTLAGGRCRPHPGSERRGRCGDGGRCTTRRRTRARVVSARDAVAPRVAACIRASCCG